MRTTATMTIGVRARATDYVALAKPRLNLLVVASTVAGYAMAHGDTSNVGALLSTVVGTALVAGGASAFNQVIERDADGLMRRTRLRPLPDGRLASGEALAFAAVLSVRRPADSRRGRERARRRPSPSRRSSATPSSTRP